MTSEERYLFDLQGFLRIENALSTEQVAALNELLDAHVRDEMPTTETTHRFGSLLDWGEPFRALIDNPRVTPYLNEALGENFRLDHEYCDVIRSGKGPVGTSLHGGAAEDDLTAWYRFHNGHLRCGLTVVAYNLADIAPGEGGFGCVPGSHKANLPLPRAWAEMADAQPIVERVTGPAGSAVIFTEALSHGTLPWTGKHERRTLFFKYSPHSLAWAVPHYDADKYPDLTESQRRALEGPNARYAGR